MNKIQAGFSLLEVIIAVAITAVMASAIGFGLQLVSGKPADKCAQNIGSELQLCRTITMGKYATELLLYRDAVTNEIKVKLSEQEKSDADEWIIVHDEVIGNANVQVTIQYQDGTSKELDQTGEYIRFKRSTGALDTTTTTPYCTSIVVTKAQTSKTITIVPLTGRISVD